MRATKGQHALDKAHARWIDHACTLWTVLADSLGPGTPEELRGLRVRTHVDGRNHPERVVEVVHSRDPMTVGPVLICDGTADDGILRRFWPRLGVDRVDVAPEQGKCHVIQVREPLSRFQLIGSPEAARRQQWPRRFRAELARLAEVEAVRPAVEAWKAGRRTQDPPGPERPPTPCNVAFITYKATADELRREHGADLDRVGAAVGYRPDGGDAGDGRWAGHFGGLRGLDLWRDVPTLVVAGRQLPSTSNLQTFARGIFYRDPSPMNPIEDGDKVPKAVRKIRMRDGAPVSVENFVHPDPLIDRVLRQMMHAELEQAIHRGRPIRRDAVAPLRLLILTDVATTMPVDEVVAYEAVRRVGEWAPLMLARGVVPVRWRERALVVPEHFRSKDASREDEIKRGGSLRARAAQGDGALRGLVEQALDEQAEPFSRTVFLGLGEGFAVPVPWRRCAYRRRGEVGGAAVAPWHRDPRVAVERWLGPVEGFTPGGPG